MERLQSRTARYAMRALGPKATAVEDGLALDAGTLARGGAISHGRTTGTLSWKDADGREIASVLWETESVEEAAALIQLRYSLRTRGAGDPGEGVVEPVRLLATRPNYGGVRWWFACPLITDGKSCGRQVAKLYAPPGARYFGCRTCHRLTYRSVQQRRSCLELWRRNPEAALAGLESYALRLVSSLRSGPSSSQRRPWSKSAWRT